MYHPSPTTRHQAASRIQNGGVGALNPTDTLPTDNETTFFASPHDNNDTVGQGGLEMTSIGEINMSTQLGVEDDGADEAKAEDEMHGGSQGEVEESWLEQQWYVTTITVPIPTNATTAAATTTNTAAATATTNTADTADTAGTADTVNTTAIDRVVGKCVKWYRVEEQRFKLHLALQLSFTLLALLVAVAAVCDAYAYGPILDSSKELADAQVQESLVTVEQILRDAPTLNELTVKVIRTLTSDPTPPSTPTQSNPNHCLEYETIPLTPCQSSTANRRPWFEATRILSFSLARTPPHWTRSITTVLPTGPWTGRSPSRAEPSRAKPSQAISTNPNVPDTPLIPCYPPLPLFSYMTVSFAQGHVIGAQTGGSGDVYDDDSATRLIARGVGNDMCYQLFDFRYSSFLNILSTKK